MIKWIAMLLMVVDHIGYYLGYGMPEPVMLVLRLFGRLSFPVFAYSVALGFLRTKNRTRYFARMFLFAAITQVLLAVTAYYTGIGTFTNVMFTFSLAILFMSASEYLSKIRAAIHKREYQAVQAGENTSVILPVGKKPQLPKADLFGHMIPAAAGVIFACISMLVILGLTYWFDPDYNLFGVFSVYLFYIIQKKVRNTGIPLKNDRHAILIMILSFAGLNLAWAVFQYITAAQPAYWLFMELFSVCSIGILVLDKPRQKPAPWEKYFFYFFYPAHLVILMIISHFV